MPKTNAWVPTSDIRSTDFPPTCVGGLAGGLEGWQARLERATAGLTGRIM
jgi:hypothetical protein